MIIYFLAVAGIILTPVAITFLILNYIIGKANEEQSITIIIDKLIEQIKKESKDE